MNPEWVSLPGLAAACQWLFLAYFVGTNGGHMILHLLSLLSMRRHLGPHALDALPRSAAGYEPPVSIIVPAYNEQGAIVAAVRALLRLQYPEYEVIVVNDGSRDGTFAALREAFGLALFPEAYWRRLKVRAVHGIYRSARFANLRVVDKAHGGKADALNAGINASRYPLYCAVDADSLLRPDSLRRIVQPLLEDPATVAAGSAIRVANGCRIVDGFVDKVGLPASALALAQTVEYLRIFLFGRLGWAPLNAVLFVSGAFAVFRKEAVVAAGGYRSGTVGEDMEIAVWLHRLNRLVRRPYRIAFVPDPVCWTLVPDSRSGLRSQRIRWQRALAESLRMNLGLLLHPRAGAAGWLAFPFAVLTEWVGPLLEVLGYVLIAGGFALGLISGEAFSALLAVALGLGLAVSLGALLAEELSFRLYRRPGQLARLMAAALIENLGYRQMVALWRVSGLVRWLAGRRGEAGAPPQA
jgi:cellulose synthase/poly-beta-1,6-N-acetylglucosamine synthase-like glycosyltransferase